MMEKVLDLFKDSALGIVLLVAILFGTTRAYVSSGSMEGALMTGDVAFCKNTLFGYTPKRGQIIGFDFGEEVYIKRVIGLPGETVSFEDGYVLIDGEPIEEDYLDRQGITYQYMTDSFTVPEGNVFVMGDNRLYSYDSRFWDYPYVPFENVRMTYLFTIPKESGFGWIAGKIDALRNGSVFEKKTGGMSGEVL